MDEKIYRIIISTAFVVGVGALIYIGIQLNDIKDYLWDLVSLTANR